MKNVLKSIRDCLFSTSQTQKKIIALEGKIDRLQDAVANLQKNTTSVEHITRNFQESSLNLQHSISIVGNKIDDMLEKIPSAKFESFDIVSLSCWQAGLSSSTYYNKHLYNKPIFKSDLEMIAHGLLLERPEGLVLEFGVFSGRTINHISDYVESSQIVYGFDSFDGLPEDWRNNFQAGTFAVNDLPNVKENIRLIKGWFNETLPKFLVEQKAPVSFIHIDCDLYSSTKCIFDLLAERLVDGTVIVFDEYYNYPGWEDHEFKAFQEFVQRSDWRYEYLGSVPSHQQVMVRLSKD